MNINRWLSRFTYNMYREDYTTLNRFDRPVCFTLLWFRQKLGYTRNEAMAIAQHQREKRTRLRLYIISTVIGYTYIIDAVSSRRTNLATVTHFRIMLTIASI
jgi:hypothetical protein